MVRFLQCGFLLKWCSVLSCVLSRRDTVSVRDFSPLLCDCETALVLHFGHMWFWVPAVLRLLSYPRRWHNRGMSDWKRLFRFSLLNILAAFVPLGALMWVLNAWLRLRTIKPAEGLLLSLMALSAMIGTILGGGKGMMAGLIVGFGLYVFAIPLLALLHY